MVSFSRKRIGMVSNGRNVSRAGCVSGVGVGNAHTGVQCQWIVETGILSAARNLREELLLLAQEAADADGRVCGTSVGAVRAGSDYGQYAPDTVPGSGTEIAGWCGYRCRRSLAPLYPARLQDAKHRCLRRKMLSRLATDLKHESCRFYYYCAIIERLLLNNSGIIEAE